MKKEAPSKAPLPSSKDKEKDFELMSDLSFSSLDSEYQSIECGDLQEKSREMSPDLDPPIDFYNIFQEAENDQEIVEGRGLGS